MGAGERMGWLRAAVGVTLLAAPSKILRLTSRDPVTASATLLLRTIGIRDIVLGLGVAWGARSGPEQGRRWTQVAMVSDAMDFVTGMASRRSVGTRQAAGAAALALLAVGGDVQALRQAS